MVKLPSHFAGWAYGVVECNLKGRCKDPIWRRIKSEIQEEKNVRLLGVKRTRGGTIFVSLGQLTKKRALYFFWYINFWKCCTKYVAKIRRFYLNASWNDEEEKSYIYPRPKIVRLSPFSIPVLWMFMLASWTAKKSEILSNMVTLTSNVTWSRWCFWCHFLWREIFCYIYIADSKRVLF